MMQLEINETPIRTAKNFGINHVKIENVDFPKNLQEFKNVKVLRSKFGEKKEIDFVNEKLLIKKVENKTPFIYGIGKIFEENVLKKANHELCLEMNEKGEEIHILYDFDDENLNLVNAIEIIANEDANVFIEYQSHTNQKCFHNGMIRVTAKENTRVTITVINLLNESSSHFEAIENQIQGGAKVKYTIVDLGGEKSITNYYTNISGERAENDLKTIYLGIKNQLKDMNYIVDLKGEKSTVDIDVQGALKDKSKKNFKGTIDFKKGAKKARGNENEYCLLLSNQAKSLALPMLLCTEDDVEGNHSTASGKVDKEEIFYIMSRGISYQEAIKLIVKARFHQILERITDEKEKNKVLQEIDRRLDK